MTEQDSSAIDDAKWEVLDLGRGTVTRRLKVPGGWLVQVCAGLGVAVTFYPDAEHQWDVPVRKPRTGWFQWNP